MLNSISYKVYENNGGTITLVVFENDKIIYVHSGYQHCPGQIREDMDALVNGGHPRDWDNNELDSYSDSDGDESQVIASGGFSGLMEIEIGAMEIAGLIAFELDNDDDHDGNG